MKKIVILSAFLYPLRSGAEACAEEVPLALSNQFDFTIVTARMRRDLPKRDMLNGKIPVIRVGVGVGALDKWLYPFLAPWVVARLKPDVAHAVLETFAGLALVFCRAPKKILTCQTTNRSFLKGFIVRRADQVTAISSALVDSIQPYRKDQIVKIPNGIHVEKFATARKKYHKIRDRILFVGRLERQKGVDILLKALAEIRHTTYEIRIVGDGSQKKILESLSQELGLQSRVTFVGRVPADQIYKEYAEAELFVGLSRSEALGNVFLEAQAAGCKILATDIEGIKDIVPAASRIDSSASTQDIAHRIDSLLADTTSRTSNQYTQYDWAEIAAQYAKLY